MRSFHLFCLALMASLTLPSAAPAGIVAQSGSVYVLTSPPADVRKDVLVDPSKIFVFAEGRHIVLSNPIEANIVNPGMYDEESDLSGNEGELPTGVFLNSYFVHFDIQDNEPSAIASGSITFDQDVLAIISGRHLLNESDAILGLPTTIYGTGGGRGWDFGNNGFIALSDDRRTVDLGSLVTTARDELRIVTAVPEADSLTLLGVGGIGIFVVGALIRNRHKSQLCS